LPGLAFELPFLDQRALDRRRELCEAEVRLNRRLAPDAVEYAVEMRRFDERDTLAGPLDGGTLEPADIHRVARVLAGFHTAAPRVGTWSRTVPELETLLADVAALLDHRLATGYAEPENIAA
jgi:aminoglycoside phosphotransferase family enzyme